MYAEQWWCGARARANQHDPLSIYSTYTYIYKGAAASSRLALYRDSIYTYSIYTYMYIHSHVYVFVYHAYVYVYVHIYIYVLHIVDRREETVVVPTLCTIDDKTPNTYYIQSYIYVLICIRIYTHV